MADKDSYEVPFKQIALAGAAIETVLDPTLLRLGAIAYDESGSGFYEVVANATTGVLFWRALGAGVTPGAPRGTLPAYGGGYATIPGDTASFAATVPIVLPTALPTLNINHTTSAWTPVVTGKYELTFQAFIANAAGLAGQVGVFIDGTIDPSTIVGIGATNNQLFLNCILSLTSLNTVTLRAPAGGGTIVFVAGGTSGIEANSNPTFTIKRIG